MSTHGDIGSDAPWATTVETGSDVLSAVVPHRAVQREAAAAGLCENQRHNTVSKTPMQHARYYYTCL